MERKNGRRDNIINIAMTAVLLLYPLRHIFHGVDLMDTGYNYANFTYIENMDSMWYYSTYLANIVGNLFTKLPLGDTLVGLNLYTGLMVSLLALMGFYFSVRVVKIPKWIAFAGAFLAVCLSWCPTALLYNYLTYIFLSLAVILLYYALAEEGKNTKCYFILAGICLGVNIFVRFSNLAQAAMIVAVWAMAIIRKEKLGKVVSKTLICLTGYLLGIVVGLGIVALRDNVGEYVNGIIRLLSMPSEASDYTLYSMIYGQVHFYLLNLRWVACLAVLIIVGMLIYKVIPEKWQKVAAIVYLCGIVAVFTLFYVAGMYSFDYHNLYSVFQWACFILVATLIAGVIVIFGKNFSDKEKLLCGMNMLVILLIPLGSNNHLFSALNIIYMVAPVTLWLLWRFARWLPEQISVGKFTLCYMPVKILFGAVFVFLGWQSILFSMNYVFTEATGGKERTVALENNEVLEWVKTDEEKANCVSEISRFVSENHLKGKEVLLYGDIPSLSFYLEMPFVLTPWPDLRSYNLTVMGEAMEALRGEIEEKDRACPVIILSQKVELTEPENGKVGLIREMIERYEYEIAFENERFVLLLTDK